MSLAGVCFPLLCAVCCYLFVVDVAGGCLLFDGLVCRPLLDGGCCKFGVAVWLAAC